MAVTRALSTQDGQLDGRTLTTTRDRLYVDIDLSLEPGTTGDIFKKRDAASVQQGLKNLLLTGLYEKPFQPTFGGNLYNMLFEMVDNESEELIEETILEAIARWEPRAYLRAVNAIVGIDNNRIEVNVTYSINNTEDVYTFTTVLNRLR